MSVIKLMSFVLQHMTGFYFLSTYSGVLL